MRKTTLILLNVILLLNIGFGQWEDISISTDQTLTSVDFLDDNIGFISGSSTIFRTDDGGDLWSSVYQGNDLLRLEDIFIVNESTIVASGRDITVAQSIIVRSIDGGNTWTETYLESTVILDSVFFPSDSIGYCVGTGTILKTVDGGDTWNELEPGITSFFRSTFFLNDTIGFVVGGESIAGIILKTIDGGTTWNLIDSPSMNLLQSIFFTDFNVGYTVGWNGEILKTEDCGETWRFQNSVSMDGNLEISFTDFNTGYITGGSQVDKRSLIQKTTDAGETWEDISPATTDAFISIDFPSFDIGYAVGVDGLVVRTESGGITSTSDLSIHKKKFDLYPNPADATITLVANDDSPIELIRLIDTKGAILKAIIPHSSTYELSVIDLQANIYYLEIHTPTSKTVKRFIKL